MIYGYARVSTAGQAKDGNSLEEQREQLTQAGATEIIEEHYTGKTTNRPKLNELIGKLKQGDILTVVKLDRLARSVNEGTTLIQELTAKGIKVNILNMGVTLSNDSNTFSKTIINIFLCFAEFERSMIVERTQEGKRIAKTKAGFHEGRPRIDSKKTDNAIEMLNNGKSYKEVSEITGISKATLIRRMREYKDKQIQQ